MFLVDLMLKDEGFFDEFVPFCFLAVEYFVQAHGMIQRIAKHYGIYQLTSLRFDVGSPPVEKVLGFVQIGAHQVAVRDPPFVRAEVLNVLDRDEAVGRRLDFLMQEFNRESNTLSSKSVDQRTTQAAVDMKVFIEQMREQVQNIE